MVLFWTPEAIEDRENIYSHIEADNPIAALDLDESFEEKAALLLSHPNLGRIGAGSQVPANWSCIRTTS